MKSTEWQTNPNETSWFKKNAIWFVPSIILMIAIPFIICGGAVWVLWSTFSPPYNAAFAVVREAPVVIERLGTPIVAGRDIDVSNYKYEDGNGHCSIVFQITGPKSRAEAVTDLTCVGDVWTVIQMHVVLADGTKKQIVGTEEPAPADQDESQSHSGD
jgi:hypothetical protein